MSSSAHQPSIVPIGEMPRSPCARLISMGGANISPTSVQPAHA